MLVRLAWLISTLLLSGTILAKDNTVSAQNLCRQTVPTVRNLWLHDTYDAPPEVATLMVHVIDGELPQVRQQLAGLKLSEVVRWRQPAMLTAVYARQANIVDALLDDGADVDAMGWVPPLKPSFHQRTVDDMQKDPRFGGPDAVKGLAATGLLNNRGERLGPALVIAAQCSDVATLDVLLHHHASVMQRESPNIVDALTAATINGDAVIVQHLLDHDADPCLDDRLMQLHVHKPGATLANVGRRAGLPEPLLQRLACPSVASAH